MLRCDKFGLLVWQDMPAGGNGSDEAKKQFEAELKNTIEGRWTHPSIFGGNPLASEGHH